VSPRRYTLGQRADAVAQTRQRVLTAARRLLVAGDVRRLTVDQIAAEADVARATVYHQFGSKAGVIEALVHDLEQRAGLAELAGIIETERPDDLIPSVVRAGCRYWATDQDLARKITALARLQPEIEQMVAPHDAGRMRLLQCMVDRLADGGVLSQRSTTRDALDLLWLLTSFDTYDLLTAGRGLSSEEVAERLTELLQARLT
jgi:AcrR family transcriptional regulator